MKKKLLIAIIAVVLAVAIPVTAFVLLGNKEEPEKADPAAEYVALQSTALHDTVNTLLSENFISNIINNATVPTQVASSANVDITISESIFALLGLEGVSFADLGIPNTLTIAIDSLQEGLKEDLKAVISMNGQEILTTNLITNPLAGVFYMSAPTISNYWLAMQSTSNGELPEPATIINGLKEVAQILPTLREPVNKYIDLALAQMKNVEKSTETVTVGGKNETATVYTNYITEKVAVNVVKAVLTEAKTDSTIKSLLPANVNLEAVIDMLLSSLPEEPSTSKAEAIQLKLYQDKNGKTIGYSFVMENISALYLAASDGTAAKLSVMDDDQGFVLDLTKNSAILYHVEHNTSLELGSLIFSGDEKNGSVTLSLGKTVTDTDADMAVALKWATVEDELTITLAFDNGTESVDLGYLIITGDENTGSATFKLSNYVEKALFGVPNIGFSLLMDWDANNPTTDGNFIISLMNTPIVTFRVYDYEESTTTEKVTFPSNALDVTDTDEVHTYLMSINLGTVFENIRDAGVSEKIVQALITAIYGVSEE